MQTLESKSAADFRHWLEKNHRESSGLWLRIFNKKAGANSLTYAKALLTSALCFGWIDGQKKPCDERSWLQRFTPRRAKSGWSKMNTEHVGRLICKRVR